MTTAQPNTTTAADEAPITASAVESPPAETTTSSSTSSSQSQEHHPLDSDKNGIGTNNDVVGNNSANDNIQLDDDGDRLPATSTPTMIAPDDANNGDPTILPLEYQCHEIDLSDNNNLNLDPFEYIFRKYIPIPRVYYWETSSPTNNYHQQLPFKIKAWHNSIYYLGEILRKAEAGGEVIANILGLNNDGPFEYVTQHMTQEEMDRSRELLERRNRDSERRREGDV
jgi:hypothetical protein